MLKSILLSHQLDLAEMEESVNERMAKGRLFYLSTHCVSLS